MFIKLRGFYVYRDAAGEGGDGGSGGGAGAPAAAGAEGAGNGSDAAGAGAAGSDKSLLATGANAEGAATTDYIPEKLRVLKEDGTLDLEASSRKLAEVYASAEKRIGTGDLPPKAAEEYAVTVPDAFKETWKPEEDQGFKDFRTKAHEAGLTQKQMDLVMGQYFEMAPQLVAGAAILDAQAGAAELKKVWSTDADFSRNIGNAFAATTAIAAKAGLSIDSIMSSPLGNNPDFLRLMAVLGPELKEDNNPGGDVLGSQDAVNDLMASEAYTNPRHKDHDKVSAQVRAYFEKKHGTEAAA